MKKTDWFPGDVKPVRAGVYEKDWFGYVSLFSRWDGRKWMFSRGDKELAAKETRTSAFQSEDPWRGLASDPKGKK